MSDIVFQRIKVLTDGGAQEGRLALAEGQLVAVLIHVSKEETADNGAGRAGWYREAGFGPCSDLVAQQPAVFDDLDNAAAWIDERIKAGPLPG
jgi:hypothetical protein